jgi:hypothetical protein
MKVAYWNVNIGEGSFRDKAGTYSAWVAAITPDIIFLEEVSFRLLNAGEDGQIPIVSWSVGAGDEAYYLLGYVNTLDVNLEPTTKCIAALCRASIYHQYEPSARVLRLADGYQRRATLKVTSSRWGNVALWGLHANASQRGGANAVDAVVSYVSNYSGNFFGGDFNRSIYTANDEAVGQNASFAIPSGYNGDPLGFTQWASSQGITPRGRYGNDRVLYKEITPHGVIDYLVCSATDAVHVTPRPNCTSAQWSDILVFFDHCPVVYDIN